MQILKLLLLVCLIGFILADGDSNGNHNCFFQNSTCCNGLRQYNYVFTLASDENLNYNPAMFGTLTPFFSFGYSNSQINQLRDAAEAWFKTRFGIDFTGVPVVNVDGCEGCKFLVIGNLTLTLLPLVFNSSMRVISTYPPEGFDIIQNPNGNTCTRYYTVGFTASLPGGITYGGTYGNDPNLIQPTTVGTEILAYSNYIIVRGNSRRTETFKAVYPARLQNIFSTFTTEVDSLVVLDDDLGVCSVSSAGRVDGFGTSPPYLSNQRLVITCPGSFSQSIFNQF